MVLADKVVEDLRCEYLVDPLGIDIRSPRLSWTFRVGNPTVQDRGQKQTAYRILVASSEESLARGEGDLWDTGKIASPQCTHVCYGGKRVRSRQRCYWKVEIWDRDGNRVDWSPVAWWEMGLLEKRDWSPADWIGLAQDTRNSPLSRRELSISHGGNRVTRSGEAFASPMFRREYDVARRVVRARAYICGLGYNELYVNGQRIGDRVLDPAQTTYDVRMLYSTYDITGAVNQGRNAFGIWLGNGFYGQNLAFGAAWLAWGPPTVICKIVIECDDGTSHVVGTDDSWKAETGPVLFDNVYAGETYDARRERAGWSSAGYDDFGWQKSVRVTGPSGTLQAQAVPPMRCMLVIRPKQVIKTGERKWIFDMGRNMAGWARIRPNEQPGTRLTLRFAEVLAPDGRSLDCSTTGTEATGFEQTCVYICKGNGAEAWEPRFTYHGFRYVEVSGFTQEPAEDTLEGVHVRSAVDSCGIFGSSSDLLNRIYRTSLWTIENNIHGIPEDCPHREKCAWLGDAHAMAETSIFNFNMAQFWTKFMCDIETVLGRGGETYEHVKATIGIPCNIAVGRRLCQEARPDWGAAIILVPWYLYLYYGDTGVLTHHYDHMKLFADYVEEMARDHIVYQGYGDWCPPGGNAGMECPVELTSTAFHYGTLMIMKQIAEVLNKGGDAAYFAGLSEDTKKAFMAKFLRQDGMNYGSQTANAVALRFGLVPDGKAPEVASALAAEVTAKHGGHSWVGIHGGRPLYTMLSDYGFDSVACEALMKPGFPGYAYALSLGFTTWPEVLRSSDTGKPVPQGSFNHPMQSGFAAWFHEGAGGIRPVADRPGFKHIELRPSGFRQIESVEAMHRSMYGDVLSRWKCTGNVFEWLVAVPPNTTATVYVPAKDARQVDESGGPARDSRGVRFVRYENGRAVYNIESGSYSFKSQL
jgi:alpha-L-rhamnosidase